MVAKREIGFFLSAMTGLVVDRNPPEDEDETPPPTTPPGYPYTRIYTYKFQVFEDFMVHPSHREYFGLC